MKKTLIILSALFVFGNAKSQTVTDIDGNIYNTINIGTQIWMKENLKTTHYQNGLPIQNVSISAQWSDLLNTGLGARCYYNNDSVTNAPIYGALYNWYAVNSANNLCPYNWHVPSDAEWTILIDFLSNNGYGYQGSGSDIAKSLAANFGWNTSSVTGAVGNNLSNNDSTHFSALPGGYRWEDGTYSEILNRTLWWSSTAFDSIHSFDRCMQSASAYISPYFWDTKAVGESVRCVCDFLTTGINKTDNKPDMNIYPNPSTGLINITFAEKATDTKLEVLNSCGQVLLSKEINNITQTAVDLSNSPKGMYFIKVQSESGVVVRKVVISE